MFSFLQSRKIKVYQDVADELCLHQHNPAYISELLSNPETSEEQIRYITDDLFGDIHSGHKNFPGKDLWGPSLLLSRMPSI